MLPSWSGKLNVIWFGSKLSAAAALVVKVDVGTTIAPPPPSARPPTCTVYWAAGSRLLTGAKVSTVPDTDSTNGCRETGAPGVEDVPLNTTRLFWLIDAGFMVTGAVTVMMVLVGTPKLPSAGETKAVLTEPASRISIAAVCPAVNCTVAVPESRVFRALALRLTTPARAGTM